MGKRQELSVNLENGGKELVIRIGIDTLANATIYSDIFGQEAKYKINPQIWAEEVADELEREEEDGSTPIHRMLDSVFMSTMDNGCGGLFFDSEDEFEDLDKKDGWIYSEDVLGAK